MNESASADWKAATALNVLQERAGMFKNIRDFFSAREVLEVDTPILSKGTVTDVHIDAFKSHSLSINQANSALYLQTSPEFAMKRLLASGSGSIFQICHAFRDEQSGRYHNPEFLMLEWYRIDFNHEDLIAEVDQLLQLILKTESAEAITYQQLFFQYLDVDPLSCSKEDLQSLVTEQANGPTLEGRDEMLQCLFGILIEPQLGDERPIMVCDYPASQSALAKLSSTDPRVAERFEVFYKGIELANGFHELQDCAEQRQRFETDNEIRQQLGKEQKPLDENFLAALNSGLPACAGVALGLDRLLMLKLNKQSIAEVMSFPFDRA